MSEIIYEIPKSVYPISVLFSFEKDQKKVRDALIEVWKDHPKAMEIIEKETQYDGDGLTFTINDEYVMIWLRDVDHGIIAHEIFHACTIMLGNLGMIFSRDSQEAYAYFIQYVTNGVYDSLKDLNNE